VILAIMQARCSSTRLPGKVLAPVSGREMILRQIERVNNSTMIDSLVVATSVEASDDPLVDVLTSEGVTVRRGALVDVAGRFQMVAAEFSPDSIVRLTADCPLADHAVIDQAINEHLEFGTDYTSNTQVRTFPQGLDVECVTAVAFNRMMSLPLSDLEREHVTMAIYTRQDLFTVHSVVQRDDHSRLRWTVDRPDDLEFVRNVYDALYEKKADFNQRDILELLSRAPGLNHTN